MIKKLLSLCLIILMLNISACGGKNASPIMITQYNDENLSCKQLKYEMTHIQGEIQNLLPKTDKTTKNVALGVAGCFFLVPWFFMDFKNGEQQEYDAYRHRYNHLARIASEKECGIKKEQYPTSAEIVAAMEKANKEKEQNKDKNESKKS